MTLSLPTIFLMACVFTSLGMILGGLIGYFYGNRPKTADGSDTPGTSYPGTNIQFQELASRQAQSPSLVETRVPPKSDQSGPPDSKQSRSGTVASTPSDLQTPPGPVQSALAQKPLETQPIYPSQYEIRKSGSMVAQIDAILQEKLLASTFPNTVIKLTEDPQMGVVVRVNQTLYQGYQAVPDENIRALIQSAVNEWNKWQDTRPNVSE